jgi:hypothetical protein
LVGAGVGTPGFPRTGTGDEAGAAGVDRAGGEDASGSADAWTGGTMDGSVDGSIAGEPLGSNDGSNDGSVDGPGAPGVGFVGGLLDGVARGEPGLDAPDVGVGEAAAVFGVGPPPVVGGDDSPEMPNASATLARTRLTTPRASTSRRRCAAVTGVRALLPGTARHEPPSSPMVAPRPDQAVARGHHGIQPKAAISSGS